MFANRIDGYRNSKRMAINGMMKLICKEEDVGYVDLWGQLCGERRRVRERWAASEWKGGSSFLPRDCQGRSPVAWVKYDI